MMRIGALPRRVAACAGIVGLALLAMAVGCEAVKEVTGQSDSAPPPDRTVTVYVWEPFEETERAVTFVADRNAPDEVKRAVKDLQNEDYDLAREALEAAVARVPTNAQAHLLLGLVNEYQGDWDAAIDAYKQSNIIKSSQQAQEGRARSVAKRGSGE